MSKKRTRTPFDKYNGDSRLESLLAGLEQDKTSPVAPQASPEAQASPESGAGTAAAGLALPVENDGGRPRPLEPTLENRPAPEMLDIQPEPPEPPVAMQPTAAPGLASSVTGEQAGQPSGLPLPTGHSAEAGSTVDLRAQLPGLNQSGPAGHTIVVQNASNELPAVPALTLPAQKQGANLLLEILDNSPRRAWSEDERQLAEQVADQLTLALENARLFEQTQARADELSLLREISLELAREQRDVNNVLEIIVQRAMELLAADGAGVWLWNQDEEELELKAAHPAGGEFNIGRRLRPNEGLVGRAFAEKHMLTADGLTKLTAMPAPYSAPGDRAMLNLMPVNGPGANGTEGISSLAFSGAPFPIAMAVPLPWQVGVIGVLIAARTQPGRLFGADEQRLSELLSSQAAAVIESARLFEQTQVALTETEALYEAGAELNAAASYQDVLKVLRGYTVLGHPAACQVTINLFDQPWTGLQKPSWLIPIARWSKSPETDFSARYPLQIYDGEETLLHPDLPTLIEDIDNDPRLDEAARQAHRDRLNAHGMILAPLNAAGKWIGHMIAAYERNVSFSESDVRRLMSLIGQAGVSIESIHLLNETQNALSETASLYQASAEMNAAQSYNDILAVLRKHTMLGQADRLAAITLFDQPWVGSAMPESVIPLARWTSLPAEAFSRRYPLRAFPAVSFLTPDAPTVIHDLQEDPRLDENARALFVQNFLGASTIFVPLVVAGRWIGFFLGVYSRPTELQDYQARRMMALAGQAAVAVQNLQSIDLAEQRAREAQQRSDELALINRVVSAVSASLDLGEALQIVVTEIVKALPIERADIALFDEDGSNLTILADYSKRAGIPSTVGERIPIEGNPSTQQVIATHQPIIVRDAQLNPLTASIHTLLRKRGIESLTILPVISGNNVVGTIGFDIMEKGRILNAEEMRLAESIVLQCATAIQNARLFDQTQQALAETERLYEASATLNGAQSYDGILEALARYTLLGVPYSNITIDVFDRPWKYPGKPNEEMPEEIIVLARRTPHPGARERYRLESMPLAGNYLRPDMPTIIADLQNDLRLDETVRNVLVQDFHAQSVIFVPLVVAGQWIGYITGIFSGPLEFPDKEVRLVRALSVQAAVAIQNIRLLEESRRRADQLQTAAEIARDTSSTLALEPLLQRTVKGILARFGYYHVSVYLVDEEGKRAVVSEATGEAGEEMKRRRHSLRVGSRSVIGSVTASGKALVVNDTSAASIYRANPLLPATRSELGIPLKTGESITGALDVHSDRPNAFGPEDIHVLQILADQISVAVTNARSYEQSQKAVEEMREVDRLKSQFLANMSHELRTPLNSIIGFSRVILKGIDGPITDLQHQDLSAIYNSGQHLLGLINDVLDLSKIEAGKMELAFDDAVDLTDLVNSVMSTAVGLVKDKQIKLYKNIQPGLPTIRADPMKIRQVLLNLLSNAVKFTDAGDISVDVVQQDGTKGRPEIKISVRDSGPGIALKDHDKLFQAFSQVDGSLTRKSGGTGLGLSICRALVEMHGGHIDLISDTGQGTTFYFTLPLTQPEPPSTGPLGGETGALSPALPKPALSLKPGLSLKPAAADLAVPVGQGQSAVPLPVKKLADLPASAAAAQLSHETSPLPDVIMCIDEEPQVIAMFNRYLSSHGYRVVALTNPLKALEQARTLRPKAITLEIRMTGLSGWKVLKDLKSDPETAAIPVIVCSVLEEARQAPANFDITGYKNVSFCPKPVLESDLLQALNQCLAA